MAVAEASQEPAPTVLAPDSDRPTTVRSLQVLRFIASAAVVVFHGYLAGGGHTPQQENRLIARAFEVGASGVHIFFIISGFVMVLTALGGPQQVGPGTFLKRRVLRIYPIYWIIALLYIAAHWLLLVPYDMSADKFVRAMLLFPDDSSAIIGPCWTLTFEMYFYLCFALFLFLPKRFVVPGLSLFMLGCILTKSFVLARLGVPRVMYDNLLIEFVAGCWLGQLFLAGRTLPRTWAIAAILSAAGLFALWAILDGFKLPTLIGLGIPSALLLYGLVSMERVISAPKWLIFSRLGDSSYFLYLIHILGLDLILLVIRPAVQDATLAIFALIAAAALTVVAAVGHHVLERPLLAGLARLTRREKRST